jgi:hypothetical protein
MRALIALLVLTACGGTEPERTPPEVAPTLGGEIPVTTNEPPPQSAAGSSIENPLPTCGAREGYRAVAHHRCPDGSMPLGGDPMRGAQARLGSTSSHMEGASPLESHIVDHYQVPCPTGAVDVFVCLYHCSGGRTPFE